VVVDVKTEPNKVQLVIKTNQAVTVSGWCIAHDQLPGLQYDKGKGKSKLVPVL
jgi:hypothetical protein